MKILAYHLAYKKNLKAIKISGIVPNIPEDMPDEPSAVYLFVSLDALENALINWLGERLDEDEEIVVLVVDITGIPTIEGANFEHVVPSVIPANRIVKIIDEADLP